MRRHDVFALLAAVAAVTAGCDRPADRRQAARPNVLLITVDTLRADRLGVGLTPTLDRLAGGAIRFTAARATAPLTLPSHASIMTGLLPPAHGVRENGIDRLAETHATIARSLRDAGYRTAAFVGAFVLDRRFGLASGFDTYDDRIPRDPNATERLEAERPAVAVVDAALDWLEKNSGAPQPAAPFFMWMHLYDPHAPYNPPPEYIRDDGRRTTDDETTRRYDGEVAYADAQIARLLDRLQARGLSGRTLIVVAGDHGEGLGEHGERTHGMLLYDSTLRVPLLLVSPGVKSSVVDEAVSLVDIAPTILRAAGIEPPKEMTGRDLMKLDDRSVARQPDLYAETNYPGVAGWSPLQALTDGRWKAIRGDRATEIYDVRNDPRESQNAAASQSAMSATMVRRLDAIKSSGGAAPSQSISSEAAERLRALGYVAGTPGNATGASPGHAPAVDIAAWNAFEQALTALNARRPDAVAALARLAASHADAPVFQTTYARALKDAGRIDEALSIYRKAATRWPTDSLLLHDLAAAARDAADRRAGPASAALREESANAERAAIALAPDNAMAHNGLGLALVDAGRADEAAREFDRATALDPTNASYWSNSGNAKRMLGDRAGAEAAYHKALDVGAPADAANGLGVLMVEAKRPAEGVPWFERALAASPDFAEARLNLGIAWQEAGDPMRAADAYRAVLAARGDHPREKAAAAKLLASLKGR